MEIRAKILKCQDSHYKNIVPQKTAQSGARQEKSLHTRDKKILLFTI